jgi:hypothetical protein
MKKLFLFILMAFCVARTMAQTNDLNIGTIHQTASANNTTATNVFDNWIVTQESAELANSLNYGTGLTTTSPPAPPPTPYVPTSQPSPPVAIGQIADIISAPQISCYPSNTVYTPWTPGIFNTTNFTVTFRRQFYICSNNPTEQINLKFTTTVDDGINNIVVDAGLPSATTLLNISTPTVGINGAPFTVNTTLSLAPGLHTIDIQCYDLEDGHASEVQINGLDYQWNPFVVEVDGDIQSANNNNVLLDGPPQILTTPNTGPASICAGVGTITLANATPGGVWSSSNTAIATITQAGVVTGITAGSVVISYTTGIGNCASTVQTTLTVNPTPVAPTTTAVTYCQGATAVPLTATGSSLLWYTAATGGVGSSTAPTPLTTTAGNTTYYVSQTSAAGCESPRAPLVVTVNPTPVAPTAPNVGYCLRTVAVPLTATGTNILWYTTATGGIGVTTAPTPQTGVAGTTTYYVSQTTGTCGSPRTPITVTVVAPPTAPITAPVNYCQGATAVPLTATGTNLNWYTSPLGSTPLATAPTPSTATVGRTAYYVSQSNGDCEGPRASLIVTVNPLSAIPRVASVSYCQGSTAIPLTATGFNINWYTTATGGVASTTAPTPSTAVAGTTTYYVSQNTGCESPRTPLVVTVNPTPVAPTAPNVGYCLRTIAVPLTATGTNILWYTVATGGRGATTAPIPSTGIPGTTTYYVSQTTGTCESPRTPITVTVAAPPVAPITATVSYCQGSTATPLTATGTNLNWYTNASGGTPLATAPTPSTTTVGRTIYYVSQSNNDCEGPRASLSVVINALPAIPRVAPVSYCQGSTAVPLTADGSDINWYTTATGGVGSTTAPTPSTAVAGTTTYYVSQNTGCESLRTPLVVTVNAIPVAPTTSNVTYCQGTTAVPLTASGSSTLLWYTTATGGRSATVAPTPSTAVAGTTTYYVSQSTSCESSRTPLVVTINPTPVAPTASNITYCQGTTAVPLTAKGSNTLLWYTTATGGSGAATAPTPSTTTVGNTTYYVAQTNGTCESARTPITVTVQICCKDICTLTEELAQQQQVIDAQSAQINSILASIATLENGTNSNTENRPTAEANVVLNTTNTIELDQNVPNPFAENTTISYNIPVSFGSAEIEFANLSGQIIKTTPIEDMGKGQINVSANDLTSGIYTYTLIVDGKTIDSKKMLKQ